MYRLLWRFAAAAAARGRTQVFSAVTTPAAGASRLVNGTHRLVHATSGAALADRRDMVHWTQRQSSSRRPRTGPRPAFPTGTVGSAAAPIGNGSVSQPDAHLYLPCEAVCSSDSLNLDGLLSWARTSDLVQTATLLEDVVYLRLSTGSAIPLAPAEAFVFQGGSVVMWNVTPRDAQTLLRALQSFERDRYAEPASESFQYRFGPQSTLVGDVIQLAQNSPDLLQDQLAFSHGLARSVKLETLEDRVDGAIDGMRGVPIHMERTGKLGMSQKEITRRMGQLLTLRADLNLHRDALLDRPDVYWEEPRLEALFQQISRNLEVTGRVAVLNKKLDYCHELVDVLASHAVAQHSSRLEWIIIALIAIEILLDVKELMIENRREQMRDRRAAQQAAAMAAMASRASDRGRAPPA